MQGEDAWAAWIQAEKVDEEKRAAAACAKAPDSVREKCVCAWVGVSVRVSSIGAKGWVGKGSWSKSRSIAHFT